MTWVEPRKIIRVGEKSYAVTIPKKWAATLGLKPGDTVNLVLEKSGHICIVPSRERESVEVPNRVVIDSSKLSDKELIDALTGCYSEGYDEVQIVNAPHDSLGLLSTITTKLPGVVILENPREGIVMKIAISENMVSLDEVTVRMIKVLSLMYDYMEEYLSKQVRDYGEKILALDDELDRLYFLGLRLIKRRVSVSTDKFSELLDHLLFIRSIEHAGDALDRSIRILETVDWSSAAEHLLKAYALSRKIIMDSISAYNNANIKLASKITERRRELKAMVADIRRLYPHLQGVASELDLLGTIAMDIAEIAVSRFIRKLSEQSE